MCKKQKPLNFKGLKTGMFWRLEIIKKAALKGATLIKLIVTVLMKLMRYLGAMIMII
jgi:hypothetical protein